MLEKLTTEKANYGFVALTPDAKMMAFNSDRLGGRADLFIRDMVSGQDRTLDGDDPNKFKQWAQIDASGTEVVYTMLDPTGQYDAYVIPAQGGAKRKICSGCGPIESLSPDGKQFLTSRRRSATYGVNVVDIASGESTLVLDHSQYRAAQARFSRDGKWIVFMMVRGPRSNDVMVAPFRGAARVPEQDWITITPEPMFGGLPFWSPDDGTVYYMSDPGGLMARHLDRNHHPVGAPFRVFQFSGRLRPQGNDSDAMVALPGRFIGAMSELSFNIWMMDLPR